MSDEEFAVRFFLRHYRKLGLHVTAAFKEIREVEEQGTTSKSTSNGSGVPRRAVEQQPATITCQMSLALLTTLTHTPPPQLEMRRPQHPVVLLPA